MRINVLGTSGSGKTSVARRIAKKLNIPYVELDELFWKPNWTESTDEEFFPKLEEALSADAWVLDGNYTRTIPIKWKRCQMVMYLDLPFHIVFYRVLRRTFKYIFQDQVLWAGNKETFWRAFFTADSIILWTLKTFSRNRKDFLIISQSSEYSHINFVRLCSRREVENFIKNLNNLNKNI